MRNLFQKFQQTVLGSTKPQGSKDDAKQRLKILLVHDQVNLTQAQLDKMKEEIMEVVAKYVEVDDANATFKLDRDVEDGAIALVSSFPVRRVTGAGA